jgi:hypothetical protein
MSRGDTTSALDHFTKGVALAETMGQPAIHAQALGAQAAAQAALNDPAAVATYRRALSQAKTAGDLGAEANTALGLGQLLLQQGARVEGSQMLQEAAAAARRMGQRGASLSRRAEDLLAGIGPLETVAPARAARSRRSVAEERRPRPAPEAPEPETTPMEPAAGDSGDAVFRETTLPPL